MTESLRIDRPQGEQQEPESAYERFRDSLPRGEDAPNDPKVGVLWREADRWRATLRDAYAAIEADSELSDEGKRKKYEAALRAYGPRIERAAEQAKAKAAKLAEDARRRSIPGAKHEKLHSDPHAQTNVHLEASELRERAARLEKTVKVGNLQTHVTEMLRKEYKAGMETGGLAGATTCAAVLRAAKVMGVEAEEIYGNLREEHHLENLREAGDYWRATQLIDASVPSFERVSGPGSHWKRGGTPRRMIPKGGPIAAGFAGRGRRRSW